MSDYKAALVLVEQGCRAFPKKDTELYAHLLNSAGACYYENNDLKRAREAYEQGLQLRTRFATKDKSIDAVEELANSINNLGNVESAEGNLDKALELFARAEEIRARIGAGAVVALGVTHLTTGRAHFLKKEYAQAFSRYEKAEDIFMKVFGPSNQFIAQ